MASEIKANKISPATGTAFTFGDSGDTFTIPAGATIANSGTATGFGDNTPSFRAYLSTNQTGLTNSAWNKINFNTEDWDTDSAYDNSTNYRFTVPAGEGGKYVFSGEVGIAVSAGADAAGDYIDLKFYVNGAAYTKGDGTQRSVVYTAGADNYVANTSVFNLSATDYVECYAYHNLGTSRQCGAATSFFSGFKLVGV